MKTLQKISSSKNLLASKSKTNSIRSTKEKLAKSLASEVIQAPYDLKTEQAVIDFIRSAAD
jgi:hypothetical protein